MTPALQGTPWQVPDWPAPAGVRALFTTRGTSAADGASAAPRQHFNLGDHVGDDAAAVAANRQRLQQGMAGARPVFMQQVHGRDVLTLRPGTADGATADAAATQVPGLACTVMVADCLPVLLAHRMGSAVAAAHAGWRGLAGGVLEEAVRALRALAPTDGDDDGDVLAWLGPCIGPRAFEVGPEVREAFTATHAAAAACFAPGPGGKYLADLPALARLRLAALGVRGVHGNDGSDAWCTVAQPTRWFSYRRDQARLGATGRMAACVWLEA
ncbi:MAG: peptidoglycan editing factor PgeF [Pseudomonadota bacterium]|nr:peptidoglycan editing factor PgeF [Pseudomonadota bacterium]